MLLVLLVFASMVSAKKNSIDFETDISKNLFALAKSSDTSGEEVDDVKYVMLLASLADTIERLHEQLATRDSAGRTPCHVAALVGMPVVLEALLINGGKKMPECMRQPDKNGRTTLHLAVESVDGSAGKKIGIMQNWGGWVDVPDGEGATPLHLAAQMGRVDAVKALASYGAALNALAGPAHTPLHLAALQGEYGALRALIVAGADLNLPDQTGYTPLHLATIKFKPSCIRALAEAGANLEAQADFGDEKGNGATALQVAVKLGCTPCVVSLVEAGADIDTEAGGMTPLELAGADENMLLALTMTKKKAKEELVKDEL